MEISLEKARIIPMGGRYGGGAFTGGGGCGCEEG